MRNYLNEENAKILQKLSENRVSVNLFRIWSYLLEESLDYLYMKVIDQNSLNNREEKNSKGERAVKSKLSK